MAPRSWPPRSIVVALDGSAQSWDAFACAMSLAKFAGAKLDIIEVVASSPAFERHPDLAAPLLARLRVEAERELDLAVGAAARQDLKASAHRLEGYPTEAICGWIAAHDAGLAILGSRGLSGQRIHLVGSVSRDVVRFSSAPTLVARNPRLPRKLLVPVDGSVAAERAVAWAAGLASDVAGRVALLYVIPQGSEEVRFTVTQAMSRPMLEPLERSVKERGARVGKTVVYGQPAEAIVRAADEHDADLIVMGRVGRATPPGFALGGVTEKVLHHATRSVLVVP